MGRRYTVEEACEANINDDNFRETESVDSLDDSFSDTSSSISEIDSNPQDDFSVRNITVKTPSQRGRPCTRDMNQQSRGRVRARGGINRGVRTREFNRNPPPTRRLASAVTVENL